MTSLFYVNVDFMDYLKPVCFMLIIFFSFVKEDIIAHYLAHTRKSGSCLRKARVPEYQLHAILMYVFMRKEEKKKDAGGKILSTESYGFQKKKKYLLFLNP